MVNYFLNLLADAVLVLYSHKEEAWKIGDFGLTVEGTSQKAHTTQYSRGTCSYRAPELVQYVENRTYTNKVDIWAMGCILYELVFHKKAFPNDHAVYLYSLEYPNSGATLDIPVMSDIINDKARMAFVSRILSEMLDVSVRTRPRADSICKRFIAWAVQSPQLPSFVEMTNIDLEHSATNPEGQIVIERTKHNC
jgi:serine/threonine protein kinase